MKWLIVLGVVSFAVLALRRIAWSRSDQQVSPKWLNENAYNKGGHWPPWSW